MMSFTRQEVSLKMITLTQTGFHASILRMRYGETFLCSYLYIDIKMKSVVLDVFFLKKQKQRKAEYFSYSNFQALVGLT